MQDAALVMSTVQSLLTQSICNINQESFISVEVSLLVFYFVSESGFEKVKRMSLPINYVVARCLVQLLPMVHLSMI